MRHRAGVSSRRTVGNGPGRTAPLMDALQSQVRVDSPEFTTNQQKMTALVADLRRRIAKAREGGGARYLQRHRDQGKLPARERIDRLLDAGSPFLELSPLAAWGMYED